MKILVKDGKAIKLARGGVILAPQATAMHGPMSRKRGLSLYFLNIF